MAKQQLEFEATVSAARLNKLFDDLKTGGESAARDLNAALGGTVKKTVLFETKADETGARKLVAVERERLTAVDRLSREQQKLNNIQRNSVTSLRQQVNEAKQARDQIAKYNSAAGLLGGQVRSINSEWLIANNRVAQLSRQLDIASASGFWQRVKADLNLGGITNFSSNLVAITQGFQAASIVVGQFLGSINQVVNTAAELQQFALTFQAIGQGSAGGADALLRASKTALGLGVNLATVEESFRQLSPVVLNVGGSIQDVDNITNALSSRFAAFGISGDKARRVMNGVIQAFAKGKLQAEELTQQISEADPAFKTDLARAVGVTTAELEKMVKAGELTSEKLITLIPQLSKSALLFGKLGPTATTAVDALERGSVTIDQVRANLQTLNTLSLRNLAKSAEPVINAFFRVQAVVTDFFTRVSDTAAVRTLATIFAKIVETLGRVIDSFLILAEGALRVVDTLSPLIDTIVKIPGLFEIAGLAILSKFLKPLQLLQKSANPVLQSQNALVNGIRATWNGSAEPIAAVRSELQKFREVANKPIAANQLNKTAIAINNIKTNLSAVTQATSSIDNVSATATSAIDSKISNTESRLQRLQKKLKAAVLESELTTLRSQRKESQPVIAQVFAPTVPTELKGASTGFIVASRSLDQFKVTANGSIGITNQLSDTLRKAIIATRDFSTEAGVKTPFIGKNFLQDIEALARVNPDAALTLLRQGLAGLQQVSRKAASGLQLLDEETQALFRSQVTAEANKFKEAIKGIVSETATGKNIAGRKTGKAIADNFTTAASQVNAQIKTVETELRGLYVELAKEPKDGLSKRTVSSQKEIQAQIRKTTKALGQLYAAQEQQAAARTSARREAIGFTPGEMRPRINAVNEYISATRKAREEEALATDPKVRATSDALIRAKEQVDDSVKAYQKLERQIRATFALGTAEDVSRLIPAKVIGDIDNARAKVKALEQSLRDQQNVVRRSVADQLDLGKAFAVLDDDGAGAQARLRAIASVTDVLGGTFKNNARSIKELNAELRRALKERKGLEARTGFRGAGLTGEERKRLAEVRGNEKVIREELQRTKQEQRALLPILKSTEEAQRSLKRESTAAGRAGTAAGRVFASALRGVTAPLKGIGLIFKSAANGVTGLLASLGPLQIAFAGIGVATRLYADGNREAAQVAKDFAAQTDLLKQALDDIRPGAEAGQKTTNSLEKAWSSLAASTVTVGDAVASAIERIIGSIGNLVNAVQTAFGPLGQFAIALGSIGTFAALGARIGKFFGPQAGTVGALIGGLVGVIVALGATADETDKKIQSLGRRNEEIAKGAASQAPLIQKLGQELKKLVDPKTGQIDASNLTKAANAYGQLSNAIAFQKQQLELLKNTLIDSENQYKSNIDRISKLPKAIQEAEKAARSLYEQEQKRRNQEDPTGQRSFQESDALKAAKARIQGLKKELSQLEEQNPKLIPFIDQLKSQIDDLGRTVKDNTVILDENAKLLGKVTSDQANLLNSTGKLESKIKELNEESKNFDLKTDKGRKNFDQIIGKAQDLQEILDFVSKTKYEINIETKKIDESIRDAQIRIDLDPGPVREVSQLANKINNDIDIAGIEFARTASAYNSAVKEGSISQADASQAIQIAAREYAQKTRDGSANLLDAARGFREQLNDATNSLRNLKLSNPDFFTPEELRANAQEIETNFRAALEKVRRETGNTSFSPRFEGKTGTEILAAKQRFIETREEAETLENTIRNISSALDVTVRLLARIAGVELVTLKNGGIAIENLLDQVNNKTIGIANNSRTIGEVYGTIVADGREYVMFMNTATGQTETLTRAQFNARKSSEDLAAKMQAAGQQAVGAATKGSQAVQAISRIGTILGTLSGGGQSYIMYWDNVLQRSETVTEQAFKRLQAEQANKKALRSQAKELESLKSGQFTVGIKGTPEAIIDDTSDSSQDITRAFSDSLGLAISISEVISSSALSSDLISAALGSAANELKSAADKLLSLDGQSIAINVNYSNPPGRWTGGPVDAGSQYRVNELGQEGFLSASGRISAINRPKNALWRAPSSGTVIPADVWSNLRVPNPTISANRPISSGFSGGNGLAKIARVLQAGMARNAAPSGLGELAAVQAHQAKQIGKLGRAVDDLASKDWNVNVKVKSVGNAAYLEALNHRM